MSNKFLQVFKDERGQYSSNRMVGILCAVSLCAVLFIETFSKGQYSPSSTVVDAVALLAFGALGLGAANKIFKKPNINESIETSDTSGGDSQ